MAQHTPRIWATLDPFVEGGAILGRKIANSTFLHALLSADPYDGYHFFLPDEDARQHLIRWAQSTLPPATQHKVVCFPRPELQTQLSRVSYHCMHLSDALTSIPQLSEMRNAFSQNIFPVTGVTHSLSYARYMSAFTAHLWQGVSSRDRIIVTSRSAQDVVGRAFQSIRDAYRLPDDEFHQPQLAQIALGIIPEQLPTPEERWDHPNGHAAKQLRADLDIKDETVFLCLSRFSPYSKMDLMPLFAAFKRALAQEGPQKSVLILAGWAEASDPLPESLQNYARGLGIDVRLVLRPDEQTRRSLYAASDVFISPSDNIQETFGLTVAEAGMASLPVIASDFDGYRDIVVPEETGLLVPTTGFFSTQETDIQALLWFDNQYHLKLAQQVAIDVPQLAAAIVRLRDSADLRHSMGLAGRKRALEQFAWPVIIEKYVALWDALAEESLDPQEEERLRSAAHPLRMRFSALFQKHCSEPLDEAALQSMALQRTQSGDSMYRGAIPIHMYAGMEYIIDADTVRFLLLSARKPVNGVELFSKLRQYIEERAPVLEKRFAQERAQQTMLWALKQDFLERVSM